METLIKKIYNSEELKVLQSGNSVLDNKVLYEEFAQITGVNNLYTNELEYFEYLKTKYPRICSRMSDFQLLWASHTGQLRFSDGNRSIFDDGGKETGTESLIKCLGEKGGRFVIVLITLWQLEGVPHSNAAIFDKLDGRVHVFEPHGATIFGDDDGEEWYRYPAFLAAFRRMMRRLGISPEKINPLVLSCPYINPQFREIHQFEDGENADGFCIAWSMFFVDYMLDTASETSTTFEDVQQAFLQYMAKIQEVRNGMFILIENYRRVLKSYEIGRLLIGSSLVRVDQRIQFGSNTDLTSLIQAATRRASELKITSGI